MNSNILAFNITLACNFRCSCCAKPNDHTSLMPVQQSKACRVMDDFFKMKLLRRVHFTGGEPFLEYNLLVNLAKHANSLGVASGVVTNASWCTSKSIVEERAEELHNLSLDLIAVSYDAYHSEFVPIENIILLINQAKMIGLKVIILSVYSQNICTKNDILLSEINKQVQVDVSKRWLVPSGRASGLSDINSGFTFDEFDGEKCIQNLGTILPDGIFFPCCSAGSHNRLSLGNIFEIGANNITKIRNNNHLLAILKREGPIGVLNRVPDYIKNNFIHRKYSSACHLCYEMLNNNQLFDYTKNIYIHDLDLAESILLSSAIMSQ